MNEHDMPKPRRTRAPRAPRAEPNARRDCTTCGASVEVGAASVAHLAPFWECYDCERSMRVHGKPEPHAIGKQGPTLEWVAPGLAEAVQALHNCAGLSLGRAHLLTFRGRSTLPAVRYSQRRETLEGSEAYRRGERSYNVEALYVLGNLPASYVRNPGGTYSNGVRFRFQVKDDPSAAGACAGTWYVAGHSNAESRQLARELGHYSGAHFILFRQESEPVGPYKVRVGTARTL